MYISTKLLRYFFSCIFRHVRFWLGDIFPQLPGRVGPWDSNPRSGSKVWIDGSRVLEVAVSLTGQSCCFDGSESAVGSSCSGGSGAESVLIMGSWAVGVEVPSLAGLSC